MQYVAVDGLWEDAPSAPLRPELGTLRHAPLYSGRGLQWAGPANSPPSPLLLHEVTGSLPWNGGALQSPQEQAAVWLLNFLAPRGACAGASPGEHLLTAGAL
eukprot:15266577-Alexandrium_andersonii.AAC.1